MGLFNDNINYETYEESVIKDDQQVETGIVLTDTNNYNYIFESETPIENILNQLPGYK